MSGPQPPNASEILKFVQSTIAESTHSSFSCSNWPQAESLCSEFALSYTPEPLFVAVENDVDFSIHADLLAIQPEFTLLKVLVKLGPLTSSPLSSQINVLNIPGTPDSSETDSFEKIRTLLTLAISPYFEYVSLRSTDSSSASLSLARKKFNELTLSLRHLQQKIHIPDLLLSATPHTKQVLQDPNLEVLEDTVFLNELTGTVNTWIRQIQSITGLTRHASDGGSIQDEVLFWKSMETALSSVQLQTSLPEVKRAIEILNGAKRFQVTLAFQNNLGLLEKLDETKVYNALLKDLPIADIVYSKEQPTDLAKFESAVVSLFNHLKRWKNLNTFPLSRMIELIELLLKEIVQHLVLVLTSLNLLALPLDRFTTLYNGSILHVLTTIDTNIKFMVNVIRELMRRRQEKFMVIKIDQLLLTALRDRLSHLANLKLKHEEILLTLSHIHEDEALGDDLATSFSKHIVALTPFDDSKQGISLWDNNEQIYLQAYTRILTAIASSLNRRFETCETFNEYLSLFKSFQNDGHKPSSFIISLVEDKYKLRILEVVYGEVQQLFKLNFAARKESFPKFDNALANIIWDLSLQSKLNFYILNLTLFLGENWDKYSLGSKIDLEVSSFLDKINPQITFESWTQDASVLIQRSQENGSILKISANEESDNDLLVVNFDPNLYALIIQAEDLLSLGFEIPVNLLIQLDKIKLAQPLALALAEHIEMLETLFTEIFVSGFGEKFGFLLETQKEIVFAKLNRTREIDWSQVFLEVTILANSTDMETTLNSKDDSCLKHINLLQEEIYKLFFQANSVNKTFDYFQETCYSQLLQCEFTADVIALRVHQIQEEVFTVSRNSYHDLGRFVEIVNQDVARVLTEKCLFELQRLSDELDDGSSSQKSCSLLALHSILFENQSFLISPLLESTKLDWIDKVNNFFQIVELQPMISLATLQNKFQLSYPEKLEDQLLQVLRKIDSVFNSATTYFEKWIAIQDLLSSDVDLPTLLQTINGGEVGDEIQGWLAGVHKVLDWRKIFDNSQSSIKLGNSMEILYSSIQSRVTIQFDAFQTKLFNKFKHGVLEATSSLSDILSNGQTFLLGEIILLFDFLKLMKQVRQIFFIDLKQEEWRERIKLLKNCQLLLHRQRVKLLSHWIYVEQLESQQSNLSALVTTRVEFISDNLELFNSKIKTESSRCKEAIGALIRSWSIKKPISGNLEPSVALLNLAKFQTGCNEINERKVLVCEIATRLDIQIELTESLEHLQDELNDLKFVWSSLQSLWDSLEDLKTQKWSDVHPRTLKHQLENILSQSRSAPAKVRQYSAFDELQGNIKSFLKDLGFLSELKNTSLKEKHWKKIFQVLCRENLDFLAISVNDVLKMNVNLHENIFRNIINQANSEQVIEEGLETITQEWSVIIFETFNFEGKCRLVKNWNNLFEQCTNNLNSLASMKYSAFYGQFEKDRAELEDKISKLMNLFNTWIDVQRQWVYLEGVFGSSSEIKSSLPVESSRFNNISFEFISLLKKINSFNLVIEILSIEGIQETMEKFSETLMKTRKGLTDYLERQRERFPRFYFVGNEDLLELIGCGTDMTRINRHLKQMFSGIASIDYNNEISSIVALNSPEGEKLILNNPVSLIKYRELTQWLKELEFEMKSTLSSMIGNAVQKLDQILQSTELQAKEIEDMIQNCPNQVIVVAFQVYFTTYVTTGIDQGDISSHLTYYTDLVKLLASFTSKANNSLHQKRIESLIIEVIHHRDIVATLVSSSDRVAIWNCQQLFYYNFECNDSLLRLNVKQGRFEFLYGFEYQGVIERLAFTPLIDKCFLSMTQALAQKLGGSPFGPAGTGKTESIKALGHNLGRMVVVFCCDDSFDFQSMGRIFLGLCKVGCWGCFDEFNRLDSKILSALSSQIENIEAGLKGNIGKVDISGRLVEIHSETGIFVTMNPGYVGRNELPENLKKLFRSFSMEQPDREVITDVILTSRSFKYSKEISSTLIPFFLDLARKTSQQPHYDFGLRTLKSILNKCGETKRKFQFSDVNEREIELQVIYQCLKESITPKLIKEDENVLEALLAEHFPNVQHDAYENAEFVRELLVYALENGISASANFIHKALQILQIQNNHHGFMLVGETGSGKTTLYHHVLNALSRSKGGSHQFFVIDCKIMSKEDLYGSLDVITRDWTDGLFTKILRTIIANLRGERNKRTWIVFDGDIDPEWAENLNSVLDDNKVLTLPNGERLELPPNVRIVFEIDSLKYTTLATISRCGMVWFDRSLVEVESLWKHFLHEFKSMTLETNNDDSDYYREERLRIYNALAEIAGSIVDLQFFENIISHAERICHIMDFDNQRAMRAFFTYFGAYCSKLVEFEVKNPDVISEELTTYVTKALLLSAIWGFAGDSTVQGRDEFSNGVVGLSIFEQLKSPPNIIEYDISIPDFEWVGWSTRVEIPDLDPHQVVDASTIVPTVDTVSHENLIHSIINRHSPLILCGPPGSGKTMTLLRALRKSPDLDVISLNFSKNTSPETLLATLEHHCEYKKTISGISLAPKVTGKWVVVFCDEINLPAVDKYGTQRVISFIRQMVENGGFWRSKDKTWVSLHKVQFVGACNDPNDPGRNKLANRFMRHVCLVMVDYPGLSSMRLIYQAFNLANLKCAPNLRGFADVITDAMLQVYYESKKSLTPDKRSHYIYSPRELTRWCRGILETLMSVTYSNLSDLVRLWFHEGLRLFFDRLVEQDEKSWCKDLFWRVSQGHFPHINLDVALEEPVLYSTWLTLLYEPVREAELRPFARERLRVFSEEEMDIDLILFEDLLDHALRIDRVLRQHQGHMILVGPSTSGKTTLAKFVAWMNGLKVVQLRVHSGYTIENFDHTLRELLFSCAKGERICFLIDESSILETSFIERMNTLLANSEIPGLFEGEDLSALYKLCTAESAAQGLLLDSDEELYDWFTKQISEYLHVVFTIGDIEKGNRPQVHSSPALFNRCVLSWMGDWTDNSLAEVATSMIQGVPLDLSTYQIPSSIMPVLRLPVSNFREAIVDALVFIHRSSSAESESVPNRFIKCVELFVQLFTKGLSELEENQRHTNIGLDKLRETVLEVTEMKKVLSGKKEKLILKDEDAKKMLNRMIVDQNEAERKREFSVATQVELEKQEIQINARRTAVMQDLELAEPAVLEAQRGVQNIKKQHLTEMRSMSNPPAAVKMAMESVCILLGYQASSWRDVQLIVRKDDFISNIVSYDNETQLTSEMRQYMEDVYLSRSDYNYEAINRASKACGPLLQWVVAQLRFSSILDRIGPLREEVVLLESTATKSRAQLIAIAEMIQELEDSIESYKDGYSELIREAEKIKVEISSIEKKVTRSMTLIENLTNERERWKSNIRKFESERERTIGNSILASAFTVYSGNLDQKKRNMLVAKWRLKLKESAIEFEETLSLVSLLTSRNDIAKWTDNGLALDELFMENFAMKAWCKIPFIIDPSGTIADVLLKSSLPTKIIVTSFFNDSFIRQVEDAMRFGGTILIQNAESYNPILDSILRNEVSQNGGRKTIRFGTKEVDILDEFQVILYTKNGRINIPPFLASRTTLLNFTITSSNLENQVLNLTLQHVRPDLYTKRNELVALQSECQIRLLNLRQLLLNTLNDVTGTILDSDDVIESLEELESESSEIDLKISESEAVINTVDEVRYKYSDIATHSTSIYEVLMCVTRLNELYNFSLATFIESFQGVMREFDLLLELSSFLSKLYLEVFAILSPTLKERDKVIMAVCMATSYHKIEIGPQVQKCVETILNHYLSGSTDISHVLELCSMDSGLGWDQISLSANESLKVVSCFAEQLINSGTSTFMDTYDIFTGPIVGSYESKYGLQDWVQMGKLPILLSTSEGFDATFKVELIANDCDKQLRIVSMGSQEGIELANKEIDNSIVDGSWVLIQNIQMSPSWLTKLETKLEGLQPGNSFRLFLTCTLTAADIPSGLIAASKVVSYETTPGLKAMLLESFDTLTSKAGYVVSAYKHVCFLLSWYHSVIQERLKYVPISFSQRYDINDSDLAAAGHFVRQIFSEFSGSANVEPGQVPWQELAFVIGQIVYGGKISNGEDAKYCTDLAKELFSGKSYGDFSLVAAETVRMPEGNSTDAYRQWILEVPEKVPLSWIGLPEDVSTKMRQREAEAVAGKVIEILR